MEIIRQQNGVLQFRGDLHVSEAESFQKALLAELSENNAFTLDLSQVNSCDAASLQLFFALRKSAEQSGKAVGISAPSMALRETSAILGLSLEEVMSVANRE